MRFETTPVAFIDGLAKAYMVGIDDNNDVYVSPLVMRVEDFHKQGESLFARRVAIAREVAVVDIEDQAKEWRKKKADAKENVEGRGTEGGEVVRDGKDTPERGQQ